MSRLFKRISEKELKAKIKSGVESTFPEMISSEDKWKQLVDWSSIKVQQDLSKVEFSTENIDVDGRWDETGLVGMQTLDNGLTFLGVSAGGDWECPLFFIVYWDGKKLRGYIPRKGNTYNTTTKKAFGNDPKQDGQWIKKYRPDVFEDGTTPDMYADELAGEYSLYLIPNPNEIVEDIKKRFKKRP